VIRVIRQLALITDTYQGCPEQALSGFLVSPRYPTNQGLFYQSFSLLNGRALVSFGSITLRK
jgi:hypothetical protein